MGVFKDQEDWIKNFCIANAHIQHTVVVDDITRKSYFRSNLDKELIATALNGISYPCVATGQITGKLQDIDNAMQVINHVLTTTIVFLDRVDPNITENGNGFADAMQNVYDSTFQLMEDFIKAIIEEYEESGNCGAFTALDFNNVTYKQVGPYVQNEYGWAVFFQDKKSATRINS